MNNSSEDMRALVICSDERGPELVQNLAGGFRVILRKWTNDAMRWTCSEYKDGSWLSAESEIRNGFDVLFVHTGNPDAGGILPGMIFRKEFAFSGGGLPASPPPLDRENAIPIQRRFRVHGCPVKPRHIPALKEFIRGTTTELPAFCRHDETVPSLWALSIVCKAYAAAGVAHGGLQRNHPLVKELGWQGTEWERIPKSGEALGEVWAHAQVIEWWRMRLGFGRAKGKINDEKYQEFLARLILDLELDVLASNELGLAGTAELADKPLSELFKFLSNPERAPDVVALLEASTVSPERVASAYKEVAALLALR